MIINRDIAFLEKNIVIKIDNNNCLLITYTPDKDNNHICSMTSTNFNNFIKHKKTFQDYEIIFNKNIYEKIKKVANNISNDIRENCKSCLCLNLCLEDNNLIINSQETNKKNKRNERIHQKYR